MREYDELLSFIGDNPNSSRAEIKEGCGFTMSDATLKRMLQAGVKLGDIEVLGQGRATRYARAVPVYSGKKRKYPAGIQTFEKIISEGYTYIDKTDLVYSLANSDGGYFFLSRPRRFGKSLLVSTLKSYFEGRKDLFSGLAMEKLEKNWTAYPVIHLDLSLAAYELDKDTLLKKLDYILRLNETILGLEETVGSPGMKLQAMVVNAYGKYGQKVVVLIDEYDSPVLGGIYNGDNGPVFKLIMRELYAPLKNLDPYLRFVFLTGITKFSQLSVFSALNNLADVSFSDAYATICGFTAEDMDKVFDVDIIELASRLGVRPSKVMEMIKQRYDGYHFSPACVGVYNPFSLLKVFVSMQMEDFWFYSGTPTVLFETMKQFGQDISDIDGIKVNLGYLLAPTEELNNAIPLLFQSGYLTIKKYLPKDRSVILGIPNSEVRRGLTGSLLPAIAGCSRLDGDNLASSFAIALRKHDIDGAMTVLQAFFAGIPYPEFGKENALLKKEAYYKRLFYTVFSFMNMQIYTEVQNSEGRTDAVMVLDDSVYVVEFKVDASSAREAIEQISTRGYATRYGTTGRKIYKLGINFSSKTGTIGDWVLD
mgnify:FL=1